MEKIESEILYFFQIQGQNFVSSQPCCWKIDLVSELIFQRMFRNKPKMAYSRDAYIRETRERLERN